MAKHKHVINLSEMAVDRINAPEGSPFGGLRQRVGAHIGAQKLGYSFFNVPPGKAAFPYHTHSGNEEMIYIIDGEGCSGLGRKRLRSSRERSSRVRRERNIRTSLSTREKKNFVTWLSVRWSSPISANTPTLIRSAPMQPRRLASKLDFARSMSKTKTSTTMKGRTAKRSNGLKGLVQKHDDALSSSRQFFPPQSYGNGSSQHQ